MDLAAARRNRRVYLVGLYLFAATVGVGAGLATLGGSETHTFLRILVGLVLAHVVVADARAIGKPLPHLAGWQLCILWPLAIPGCVIALRKGRGVLYLVGHGLLFVAVFVATAFLVDWLLA